MTSSYSLPSILRPQAALGDFQDFVKREAGDDAYLDIPRKLEPKSRMYRIAEYFQSANKEEFGSVPLTQGDIDRFFTDSPIGTYRLGFWGHGVNSYALYLQSRSEFSTVFLRILFGGVYEDNAEDIAEANRYLKNLSEILDECEDRDIRIEVCESMGYGFYRLFTPDGVGIEFEESLFDRADAITRFKKMMATFAVEISRRHEMKMFFDDDHGYRSWLNENPEGFVLQTDKKARAKYIVLHNSLCSTISDASENYTHGKYQKICAPRINPLVEWANEVTGGEPTKCKFCFV